MGAALPKTPVSAISWGMAGEKNEKGKGQYVVGWGKGGCTLHIYQDDCGCLGRTPKIKIILEPGK
jgi:hypothetical protein